MPKDNKFRWPKYEITPVCNRPMKNARTNHVVHTTFLVNDDNSCAPTTVCFFKVILSLGTLFFYEEMQKNMQFQIC